ncbi:hypothetical protein MBAV_001431, partial [Candidatus Magnetobacterium bavaricum]
MIENVQFVKRHLDREGIIVSLSGILSHSIMANIAEAIKDKLEHLETDNKLVVNVFSVFIEMAQNLINYSKERDNDAGDIHKDSGIILLGYSKEAKRYFVASGNTILASDKARI